MNNGAFGENFPYSNFHDLNMDWIIKIAKDFLDQYTNIQNIIEQGLTDLGDKTDEGLEELTTKYTELDELLQTWYDTHSQDIANQLATALEDLNTWYTTHEGYLNQYVLDSITEFNNSAETKAQETLQSIPSDYTELADKNEQYAGFWHTTNGYTNTVGQNVSSPIRRTTGVFYAPYGFTVKLNTGYQLTGGQGATDDSFTDLSYLIVGGGTTHLDITNGSYFYLNIAKYDNSEFTANDDPGLTIVFDNSNDKKIIDSTTLYNGIFNFKQGYINTSGAVTNNANRICLEPIKIDKSFTIYINEGFQVAHFVGHYPKALTEKGWVLVNTPSVPAPKSLHIDTIIGSNFSEGTYHAFNIARTSSSSPIDPSVDTGFRIVVDDTFDSYVMENLPKTYIVRQDGAGDYNTLMSALKDTEDYSTIIVEQGTFNLMSEYTGEYGSTYFDDYTGYDLDDPYSRGLYINKKTIKFLPDTRVIAKYSGNNDYVQRYFSAFNIGIDATIEGLYLDYENLRYAVHDDYALQQAGKNTYKNIVITGFPSGVAGVHWGGGCGQNVLYELDNIVFIDTDMPSNYGDLSYHNAEHGDGQCRTLLNNCYGSRACMFWGMGETTKDTYCIVSGCTFRSIFIREQSTADNMVLIKNNCTETN